MFNVIFSVIFVQAGFENIKLRFKFQILNDMTQNEMITTFTGE
jgi:hypothetical protein